MAIAADGLVVGPDILEPGDIQLGRELSTVGAVPDVSVNLTIRLHGGDLTEFVSLSVIVVYIVTAVLYIGKFLNGGIFLLMHSSLGGQTFDPILAVGRLLVPVGVPALVT